MKGPLIYNVNRMLDLIKRNLDEGCPSGAKAVLNGLYSNVWKKYQAKLTAREQFARHARKGIETSTENFPSVGREKTALNLIMLQWGEMYGEYMLSQND